MKVSEHAKYDFEAMHRKQIYINGILCKIAIILLCIIAFYLEAKFEGMVKSKQINPKDYIELTAEKIDVASNTIENNDFGFLYAQQQARQAGELTFRYNDAVFSTSENYSSLTTYKATFEFNLESNNHKVAYTYDNESDIPETVTIWVNKNKASEVNLKQSDILSTKPINNAAQALFILTFIKIIIASVLIFMVILIVYNVYEYHHHEKKDKAINLSKEHQEKHEAN